MTGEPPAIVRVQSSTQIKDVDTRFKIQQPKG